MNRKRIILIALVTMVLLGGLLIWLSSRKPQLVEGPFYKLASNIQQPEVIGKEMYFFTGSSFASLNLSSGKSKLLSEYFYTTGDVIVSSYSKSSVIFGTTGTDSSDQFGQTLIKAGKPATGGAWWRYDIKNSSMALIDFKNSSSCDDMVEANNKLYCSMPKEGSNNVFSLVEYDLVSKQIGEVDQSTYAMSSLQSNNDTVFYLESKLNGSQSLHSYSKSNDKTLYIGKGTLNYGLGESQVLINEIPLSNKNSADQRSLESGADKPYSQKLEAIGLDGSVKSKVGISYGSGQLNSSDTSVVYSGKGQKIIYESSSKGIKKMLLDELNDGSVWVVNSITYYIRGNDVFVNKKIYPSRSGYEFEESVNTAPNKFFVSEANNGSNKVYLNDSGQDFAGNANSVDKFLVENGFDPNQFKFDWEVGLLPPSAMSASNFIVLN